MKNDKLAKELEMLDIFLLIIFIFIIAISIIYRIELEAYLSDGIEKYGGFALFAVNLLLEFIPQFIAPVFTYIPAFALNMNFYFVIFTVAFGSFAGSLLGYEFGRKYGFSAVCCIFEEHKIKKAVKFMNLHGRLAILLAALSPLPYIPMIIGSLNTTRKNFFIFGLIPRFLGLILIGSLIFIGKVQLV